MSGDGLCFICNKNYTYGGIYIPCPYNPLLGKLHIHFKYHEPLNYEIFPDKGNLIAYTKEGIKWGRLDVRVVKHSKYYPSWSGRNAKNHFYFIDNDYNQSYLSYNNIDFENLILKLNDLLTTTNYPLAAEHGIEFK